MTKLKPAGSAGEYLPDHKRGAWDWEKWEVFTSYLPQLDQVRSAFAEIAVKRNEAPSR